jgi:hypothetical protein
MGFPVGRSSGGYFYVGNLERIEPTTKRVYVQHDENLRLVEA